MRPARIRRCMMKLNYAPTKIPDHVPPELVRDYPLARRQTIYENPYETIIPKLHEGPAAFMASDAYLSVSPAWVFRSAADIKTIFLDTTNFIKKGHTNFAQMLGVYWDVHHIGRASCRRSVSKYVESSGVEGSFNK